MRMILIITLFLVGCASNDVIYRDVERVVYHPPQAQSIKTIDVEWKIVTDQTIKKDDVYVALEYNKFLEFSEYLEDVYSYIKTQNTMLCFYRTDLKELKCLKEPLK